MLKYSKFTQILNDEIFSDYKANLLYNLAQYPNRYVGLFRSTKPETKIIQNILQSNEIKFGDAFERIIRKYLELIGWNDLPDIRNNIKSLKKGELLNLDQLLMKEYGLRNDILFIEQKIRDDHYSTKKRGQIANFEQKIIALKDKFKNEKIIAYFYFVDGGLEKNRKYYDTEIKRIEQEYSIDANVFYGAELFDVLCYPDIFNEIKNYLRKWQKSLPEIPDSNFDNNPKDTVKQIYNSLTSYKHKLTEKILLKLFQNNELYALLKNVIFPNGKSLLLLSKQNISNKLINAIKNFSK